MKVSFDNVGFRHTGTPASSRATLEEVSFELPAGSFAALVGPNGSGKSTLARMAAGLLRSAVGSVSIDGRDLSTFSHLDRAREIALLPQGPEVAFPVRALDLVLTGRYPHLGPWRNEGTHDFSVARAALDEVGATALADREIHTLSGGERQRIFLARALAQEPKFLVADEPATHLDLHATLDLVRALGRLRAERGVTILFVTHDLDLAAGAADRVLLLDGGRLRADGRPDDVLTATAIRSVFGVAAERVTDSKGRARIVVAEQ